MAGAIKQDSPAFRRAFQKLIAELRPDQLVWMKCSKQGCGHIGLFHPESGEDVFWIDCPGCATYIEPRDRVGRMVRFKPEQEEVLVAAGRIGGRDAVQAIITAEGW